MIKIDPYAVLVTMSVMVVLSYLFNYISSKVKVPSVLLLVASGIGLKYLAAFLSIELPPIAGLLEILGITGLIFIVLEASLDLSIRREKLRLIGRALISAVGVLGFTASLLAVVFAYYFDTSFEQALLHSIPLSVISSAIAIPSVSDMSEERREFVIYESTFSDIIGIIAFNILLSEDVSGMRAVTNFATDTILVLVISMVSTMLLIFLLNHSTSRVRFFITFAILILAYSFAKFLHLPSLVLVLCFGVVLNNFSAFNYPIVHRYFSLSKLSEVNSELKVMTAETAFVIRTFFFLLFGFSIDLTLIQSAEVIVIGFSIIAISIFLRFVFLRLILNISSTPLMLIAPRGLISILLFYNIPPHRRLEELTDGVLFIVIVFTGIVMTIGLLLNRRSPREEIQDVI